MKTSQVTHKKIIEQELFSFGIRINQQPPEVKFIKKESGGINIQEMVKQTKGMNIDVARLICKEYRISCAEFILREYITVVSTFIAHPTMMHFPRSYSRRAIR